MGAPKPLCEANRLDIVGCFDLLEAHESAVDIGQHIKPIINQDSPPLPRWNAYLAISRGPTN